MQKPTNNDYPILEVLRQRWSPRAYSEKPVEREKLQSIFEAARWAPSSRNEQPWRFIVGIKGDETWNKIYETLDSWNKEWNKTVPVLVLNIGKKTFDYKGYQNKHYLYDTGQAVAMMVTEAVNQGLIGHQMGGFHPEKAIQLFEIPEDYEPISVAAFGYYGDSKQLTGDHYESEVEDRRRRPLTKTVFSGKFGESSQFFDK